jgi:glycosyltransferase involved in cell wall biosynthesis
MILQGKNLLIVSPEPWGNNMLSKHHYALMLSKLGNKVFFLPPPLPNKSKVTLRSAQGYPEITIIEYSSHVFGLSKLPTLLTDWLSRRDGSKIEQAAKCNFDLIWNFDMFRFQNPRAFRNIKLSILHPVDFVDSWLELRAARLYDFVFSVTQEIVDKLKPFNPKAHFINHGLSEHFVSTPVIEKINSPLKCGYVGNLQSFGIHLSNLFDIIAQNPEVEFHFIGPKKSSNLGTFKETDIIPKLEQLKNVVLHGEMHPKDVARTIIGFDLFLICYDPERVGKVASNSHKILEYLSTGKVVVSSRMSTYDDLASELFQMSRDSRELPALFKETVAQLESFNSKQRQEKRIAFATANTYDAHLKRIEFIINSQDNANR